MARGDDTPVEPWQLVADVVLSHDEEAALDAVSRGVPTPTVIVAWSAVWEPEFGSLFD